MFIQYKPDLATVTLVVPSHRSCSASVY